MKRQRFCVLLIVLLFSLLGLTVPTMSRSLTRAPIWDSDEQGFLLSRAEGLGNPGDVPMGLLQRVDPPLPLNPQLMEDGLPPDYGEQWVAPSDFNEMRSSSAKVQNLSGLDDFGYIWDDTVSFNWVDARASGVNTGITGDDETGLVDIGFPFDFYEQTWAQVYVSTNGLLLFGVDDPTNGWGAYPPSADPPNNLIQPFWDDLFVNGSSAAIYVLRGGSAPNRYCVIEWYHATPSSGSTNYYTFEVILYEGGDILFQYQDVDSGSWHRATGIEDSLGVDGLDCTDSVADSSGIRFYRPVSSARVSIYPLYQGSFAHAGKSTEFQVPIRNTGTLGSDTYDIVVTSSWPYFLFINGTLLTDTDGDTIEDTGTIAQGEMVTVTVMLQTPGSVVVGDYHTFGLQAISSKDTSREKTAMLRTAVPAPFVQAYWDSVDGAMRLEMVQPAAHAIKKLTEDWYTSGYAIAVAEAPNGNFVSAWIESRHLDSGIWTSEVKYVLLDHAGRILKGITSLTDHSGATVSTVDSDPALSVSPDGHIGVAWIQRLTSGDQENYNVYFAILDGSGRLAYGPSNLTNNNLWGTWDDFYQFIEPHITATTDNHFVLSWQRRLSPPEISYPEIYYAVRNGNGEEIKPPTRFDTGFDSAVVGLSNGHVLLAFQYGDIYFGVLDSYGNIVKGTTNLSGGYRRYNLSPDVVQLSNGKIVIGWQCEGTSNTRVCAAVLNTAYARIAGPVTLDPPDPTLSQGFGTGCISVAADAAGHAIFTWMDYDSPRHLYYALLDNSAVQITPSMIFHTAGRSYLGETVESNWLGYATTSYSWVPPDSADYWVSAPVWTSGEPGGEVGLRVGCGNAGLQSSMDVVLTATLDSALDYLWASPEPVSVMASASTLSGDVLVWALPPFSFLDEGKISLHAAVPDAPLGTSYPVTLDLTLAGVDANQADNHLIVEVQVMRHLYLPVLTRDWRG